MKTGFSADSRMIEWGFSIDQLKENNSLMFQPGALVICTVEWLLIKDKPLNLCCSSIHQ